MLLYSELAAWWPLLSSPADYADEAASYRAAIESAARRPVREALELGSGGGHTASHLKRHWSLTLTDLSPAMLAVSRAANPECEHIAGDMRALRLHREFDAVCVHDAVMYMTCEPDLLAAARTAFVHCRPGGVALFAPDATRETWAPSTSHGGSDAPAADGRAARYLEWTRDPDPADSSFEQDMVYILRETGSAVRVVHDRHVMGLFPHETWLRVLCDAGFRPSSLALPGLPARFIGLRP